MSGFKVTTDSLTSISQEMEEYIRTFENYNKEVNSRFDTLIGIWDDETSKRVIDRMDRYTNSELSELVNILKDYAKYLNTAAKTYNALDEAYASKTIDV